MKMLNQKITTFSLAVLFLGLASCGSKGDVAGSLDSSSRVQDLNGTKPLAYCNEFKNSSFDIHTKAYTENSGAVRYDLVYLMAESLPTDFGQDESYISMFKWKATSTAIPSLNATALKFALFDPSTKQYLTTWKTAIRWSDISALAASYNTYYVKDFFKKVHLVVDTADQQGEYDALKVVQYQYGTDKTMASIDGLLPLFHANPSDYEVETDGSQRALALQKIHPFYSLKGQKTSDEYFSLTNAMCF